MKIKLVLIALFLAIGIFFVNTSFVRAVCCVSDNPITGECEVFDACPNPPWDGATPPPAGGGGCSSGYDTFGSCCDSNGGMCSFYGPGDCGASTNCTQPVCCNSALVRPPTCGTDLWTCTGGQVGSINTSDPDAYYWWCAVPGSSGGGATDVLCSQSKGGCPVGQSPVVGTPSSFPMDAYSCNSGGCPWPSHCEEKSGGEFICYYRYCAVTCDANVWGAWSACTGTQTTQTRTNACGTTQSSACPQVGWWQVKDADVASSGDIISKAPSGVKFNLDGPGGFPGVVSYTGTASLNFGGGTAGFSTTNWLAETSTTSTKVYDSKYFANQIPADVTFNSFGANGAYGNFFESGGTLSNGYYWYRYDGSLSGLDFMIASAMNLGSRKVILIVDNANLYIGGNINLTKGSGFFMAIAGKNSAGEKGNIYVLPSVGGGVSPNLEGIYLADGTFYTGTGGVQLDPKLYVRGSVAAYGGVSMQRDLGGTANATTPAEFFEYAPDQVMLFPSALGVRKMNWKEVAP